MSNIKSKVDVSVLTSKEREALKLFKERIPDVLEGLDRFKSHDLYLIRWLRARDLNLTKAEDLLRKYIAWRAKEDVDNIMKWIIPDFIDKTFTSMGPGFDKEGGVIAIIPFGRWDVRKAVSVGQGYGFVRYVDLLFELAYKFAEHRNVLIPRIVIIFDFEGFSLGQIACRQTIEHILEVVRRIEVNHPESLNACWVVNAPKIFELLFAFIKPIVNARTMAKVRVCGSNSSHWRPQLLENIDPDQLPSHYGGSNSSCRNYKLRHGFDVFPVHEIFPADQFISVTVPASSKHAVPFILSEGDKLRWNFRTVDYDIGFSLQYSTSPVMNEAVKCGSKLPENSVDEVFFNCPHADSHLLLQKGEYLAEKSGTYSLVFDNSFSRFRAKNLSFCARVDSK